MEELKLKEAEWYKVVSFKKSNKSNKIIFRDVRR